MLVFHGSRRQPWDVVAQTAKLARTDGWLRCQIELIRSGTRQLPRLQQSRCVNEVAVRPRNACVFSPDQGREKLLVGQTSAARTIDRFTLFRVVIRRSPTVKFSSFCPGVASWSHRRRAFRLEYKRKRAGNHADANLACTSRKRRSGRVSTATNRDRIVGVDRLLARNTRCNMSTAFTFEHSIALPLVHRAQEALLAFFRASEAGAWTVDPTQRDDGASSALDSRKLGGQ